MLAMKYFFVAQSTHYVLDRKQIPDEVLKRNNRLKWALMLINLLLPLAFAIFLITKKIDLTVIIRSTNDMETLAIVVSFLSLLFLLTALNSVILFWSGRTICNNLPESPLKLAVCQHKSIAQAIASIIHALGFASFLVAYFLLQFHDSDVKVVFIMFTLCNLLSCIEQLLNMNVVFRLISNKSGIED